MDYPNLNLEKLNQSEIKNINGGGPLLAAAGVAIGVASLAAGAYATAMSAASNAGYADGKADCLPPPCTE
ncbi:class IIb bacteriocin, lactobin A/cerein 7B family [Fodinibius halophilus]|uniref:Class IIb bacteriocin, lactobin A/cerein 7B family n=1 Tax=Fodinibius halophilus TaxID=1736908 RepID=A0A6M1T8I9_9BACT|nr:class IIb bacteriocin, lactobin A/cerein 7B family [Fodinibius halophilus]NGP89755.1 class IIb bacteriocin, lactobin A/cerein 7B family [Fodinibius halophilus]